MWTNERPFVKASKRPGVNESFALGGKGAVGRGSIKNIKTIEKKSEQARFNQTTTQKVVLSYESLEGKQVIIFCAADFLKFILIFYFFAEFLSIFPRIGCAKLEMNS
jgi:hypothetical protein